MADVWVLHIDLDQFFASVEVLRRPELRGKPVVVGGSGDPTRARTVVATASREAREFGVHSGMPMRLAARKCPDAVFLPADMAAYERASARVMATLRAFPVRLEVYGLDEAFVGGDIDDPRRLAAELKAAVHDQVGLTCAIGIGRNKHQAKIAARFAKRDPAGIATLTDQTWMPVMGRRPVGDLWGVGPKTVRKLEELEPADDRRSGRGGPRDAAAALSDPGRPMAVRHRSRRRRHRGGDRTVGGPLAQQGGHLRPRPDRTRGHRGTAGRAGPRAAARRWSRPAGG